MINVVNIDLPKKLLKFSTQKTAGFTLVELMVVISIIAILSAIGLTIFSQAQIAARDARRISDMQESQKALEQYYAINSAYPLGSGVTLNTVAGISTYYQNNAPPDDPNLALVGNVHYRYWTCGATGTAYNICARLENCSGRCNFTGSPVPSGCDQVGQPGSVVSAGALYCLRAISN